MIVTIDGPSGTGKSTVAKRVAEKLGFTYCDTGAMFRAIAYGILKAKIDHTNHEKVKEFLVHNGVKVVLVGKKMHYFLGEADVTEHLRSLEVTEMSSKIATIQAVREKLAILQRELGKNANTVFEGRDMGTAIFPRAEVKVFLTADPAVRAQRRYKELVDKDPSFYQNLTEQQVLEDINERDKRDSTRDVAPLKPAEDAHIIDTSKLSIDEVVNTIAKFCNK
jgi:CMP/dCMP kinase